MIFANVESIIIPEGKVDSIFRGTEVLWRKQKYKYKRELLYLESDGHQYIDTGIYPDDACGYKAEIEQIDSSGEQCPIACMDTGKRFVGVYLGSRFVATTSSLSVGFGSYVKTESYPAGFSLNQRVISSCNYMNDRKIIFDSNEIKDLTDVSIDGTISRTIHIFNRNYTSTAIFKGRIYSVIISSTDKIIADFIPVLDMDDVPCMYDRVSGELFYNQGTGQFAYGELPSDDDARLPVEYQEVEYIESTGTQYIDTGKLAPENTDIEVRFKLNNTVNEAIFGGRSAQTSNTCTLFYLASTKPPYFRFDRVSQVQVANANKMSIDLDSIYSFSYKNDTVTVINERTGEECITELDKPYTFTKQSIQLFAVSNSMYFIGRIYEWKYYESGELQQHFVPCYRKSDSKPGMYDLVTDSFFTNQGTGEFIYG